MSINAKSKVLNPTFVGENVVVEDDVFIDEGCYIGHNVVIHSGVKIGKNVLIDDNTVIGKRPMHSPVSALPPSETLSSTKIGDDCLIGAGVIIYIGATIGKKVLVADLATIRENVEIGDYTIVGRGVAVENFCKIGSRCKLETNAYITAYSELEDYVFIAPMVTTTNDNYMARGKERFKHFKGVTVRRGARIGANATVLPGKTIEEEGVVAAGSVVARDVPSKKIVMGSPAKVYRDVPEDQLLENQ
jgi:hypothetical protein